MALALTLLDRSARGAVLYRPRTSGTVRSSSVVPSGKMHAGANKTPHAMRWKSRRLALGAWRNEKKKNQNPLSEHFPSVGENGAGVEPSWHRSFPDARTLPVPA